MTFVLEDLWALPFQFVFWLFLLISLCKKLVKWLLDTAMQAAGANQSTGARMLTLAAQIVGEHAELLQWSQAK